MRGSRIGFLLIDKIEVPEVDDGVKKIGSDKDRIHLSNSIGQKDQSPSQAEIPEGDWDDTLLSLLRGNPLNNEPHGKHRLTEKTENHPEVDLELWIPQREVMKKIGDDIQHRKTFHLRSFPQFHNGCVGSSSISQPEDRRRHATFDSKWYTSIPQTSSGGGQWEFRSPDILPSLPRWA